MDTAFEILVHEHSAMLTAFLRSNLGDDHLVDEMFQQTIVTAWRKLDTFETDRPFAPWLRGIARNHMLMQFRTTGRYRRRLEGLYARKLEECYARIDERPGDTYAERIKLLGDCISRLPEQNREAVDLVYMRELSQVRAADHAGVEVDTLRKRLHRGIDLLTGCLQKKGLLPEASP
jgi:RNA polymerase sigma factor (sigma-70 family)